MFVVSLMSDSSVGAGGTPLKAIDNICSSPAAFVGPATSRLDDIASAAAAAMSIAGSDEMLFLRPRQTSTPAGRRLSPRKKVVPLVDLEQVNAGVGDGGYSQEGGFLSPTSQSQQQPQLRGPPRVIDLTAEDVSVIANGEMLSFEPMMTNGNACSQHQAELHTLSISNFDNSFSADDGSGFKPIAASTQISPSVAGTGAASSARLCETSDTLKQTMLENGSGGGGSSSGVNAVEAALSQAPPVSVISSREMDGGVASESGGVVVTQMVGGVASESGGCEPLSSPQQQMEESRSSSPELFGCDDDDNDDDDDDDAVSENMKLSTAAAAQPSGSHPNNTSDDCKTTGASHHTPAPFPHTTLAQKLANKKLKAEDGDMSSGTRTDGVNTCTSQRRPTADDAGTGPLSSLKQPPLIMMTTRPANDVVKETNTNEVDKKDACKKAVCKKDCMDTSVEMQTRRSARLSTHCSRSLHNSRRRGVDFLDDIDKVCDELFLCFFLNTDTVSSRCQCVTLPLTVCQLR